MQEVWVRSLGQEDPLEKETATRFCFLSWENLDTGAWLAAIHGINKEFRHGLAPKQQ